MPPGAEVGCDGHIEIPPAWERITLSALGGTLLVVGAPDTGKSTFARYLYRRLCAHHERVAFDGGANWRSSPVATSTTCRQTPASQVMLHPRSNSGSFMP